MADEDTWVAIFDLFRIVDEITPDKDWVSLLEVIAEHIGRAKSGDSSFIVERLQTLLPHQALLAAKIAKGLVANWYHELGNQATRKAMNARDLVDLAITLHRLGPETREVGTSLFEDLLLVSAYTAREKPWTKSITVLRPPCDKRDDGYLGALGTRECLKTRTYD